MASQKSEAFFNELLNVCSKFFGQLHDTCEKHKVGLSGKKGEVSGDPTKKPKKKIYDPLKSDPNAPKKPIIQGYLLYYTDVRTQRQKENPSLANQDLTKMIAEEWNKLPKDKRLHYEERAKANRDSYEGELEEYLKTNPAMREALGSKKKRKRKPASTAGSQSMPETPNGKSKPIEIASDDEDEGSEHNNGKGGQSSSDDESSDDSDDDDSDDEPVKKNKK